MQREQLAKVLRHAHATTAFYPEHWANAYDPAAPLDMAAFSRLPILRRRDLQDRYEALKSSAIPPGHGKVHEARTSGSSGMPVRVLKTAYMAQVWQENLKQLNIKLEKAIEDPDLKELANREPKVKEVLDVSLKLEGVCRNAGMHAAGV